MALFRFCILVNVCSRAIHIAPHEKAHTPTVVQKVRLRTSSVVLCTGSGYHLRWHAMKWYRLRRHATVGGTTGTGLRESRVLLL